MNAPRRPHRSDRAASGLVLALAGLGLVAIVWLLWPSLHRALGAGRPPAVAPPSAASADPPGDAPAPAAGRPVVTFAAAGEPTLADPREARPAVPLRVPVIPESSPPAAREPSPPPPPAPVAPAPGAQPTADPEGGGEGTDTAPLIPPVLLRAAWLPYPENARRRRSEGQVEVRILVGETGAVTRVELASAPADTSLGRAALAAARDMQFRPATRSGRPVPVWFNYRFDFSLPRPG